MLNMIKHILKPRRFMLWIALFTLIIWTYTYYSLTAFDVILSEPRSLFLDYDNSGYLINTSGCRIPEMYLKGPEIQKYFNPSLKLNCKTDWNYTLPLITSDLTSLILNMSAWATLNINEGDTSFECYYTPIERQAFDNHKDSKKNQDNNVKLGEKIYFVHNVTVPNEMVEVVCTLQSNIIYKDYHIFIRPTSSVKNRKDGDVSVLVLGLDAVSRLNFHRQMPKTSALLSEIGTTEMLGYNKVEDNTFPNVVPVLSGMSIDELKINCWPEYGDVFDDCHFVWHDYQNANFSTTFVEDSTMIGMFNNFKSGFFKKPTDHYLRPIMIQAENELGHESIRNTTIGCIGPRLGMTMLLDYAFKIALSLANHVYMNIFWTTSLTHDYIEYPKFGDNDLREFFDVFNKSGELNKTIVILMSDHGIRWGPFRGTYQGSLEDKLPMLKFIIPEWFQNMYPSAMENLNKNTLRLTTPYDLHETLLDFIDTKQLDDSSIARRTKMNENKRGTSLFLEIPENKTCDTAGIPKNYCACHEERVELLVDDVNVIEASKAFMVYVNTKLSMYSICAYLTLYKIDKASVEMGKDNTSVRDYEIQLTTVPGFAKFEATLRHYDGKFKMVGSVSRLNVYGNQSICVNEAKLKLLCYCLNHG